MTAILALFALVAVQGTQADDRGGVRGASAPDGRRLVSRSSQYCRSDSPAPLNQCWNNKPPAKTPECTVDSVVGTNSPCLCGTNTVKGSCDVEANKYTSDYVIAYCQEKVV